jgi:hypothetical protein
MDLSTGRLEGSARVQERPFSKSSDETKRRTPRRPKAEAEAATEPADEQENHQLDDIA